MNKIRITSIILIMIFVIMTIQVTNADNLSESPRLTNESVNIASGEIHIQLSSAPVSGYIMVLLSNDLGIGWQGAIMVSLDIGEVVHYVVGDPATDAWTMDISGTYHVIYGNMITFIFPEFPLDVNTQFAVLSILSGNYDWIPDSYENSEEFVVFEQFTDGLSTIPGTPAGGGGTTPPPTSDSGTTTSNTETTSSDVTEPISSSSSASSNPTEPTSSTRPSDTTTDPDQTSEPEESVDTPSSISIDLNYPIQFAIYGLALLTGIGLLSRKNEIK